MDRLFSTYELTTVLSNQVGKAREHIEKLAEDYLLNVSESDLTTYLQNEYAVEAVHVGEPVIGAPREIDIDVTNDPRRVISRRQGRVHVKGVLVQISVPYTGDMMLLRCSPPTFRNTVPVASVSNTHITFEFKGDDLNPQKVRSEFDTALSNLKWYLAEIEKACLQFNENLPNAIREVFNRRKDRLLSNRHLVAGIGFPMEHRSGAPKTYAVPSIARKAEIKVPVVREAVFAPEPVLAQKEFEDILTIIRSMVTVMEHSPKAFVGMEEEDLRTHFLVQLNGQYQGRASGETFNYDGKTDILIREADRNVFIAECAFWKGEAYLIQKIDQILSYLHWRDTKAALIVFNRNKLFSDVLSKIETTVKGHKCCKKLLTQVSETEWQFLFRNVDDPNRELKLAVMIFDVPKAQEV